MVKLSFSQRAIYQEFHYREKGLYPVHCCRCWMSCSPRPLGKRPEWRRREPELSRGERGRSAQVYIHALSNLKCMVKPIY